VAVEREHSLQVRALAVDERRAAAELLARAFLDYPAWTAIGPRRDGARLRMLRRFYRGAIARAAGWGGEVLCAVRDGRLSGASIVYGTGRWPPPIRSFPNEAWGVALAGPAPSMRGLRFSSLLEAAHPHQPHVFVHTLGVDPRAQRRGAGRALLDSTLAAADAEGHPVHLTTSDPANLPYYRRFGFEVTDLLELAARNVRLWSMLRPASG
jgi:GNAT superfamily N-acetyltransferase